MNDTLKFLQSKLNYELEAKAEYTTKKTLAWHEELRLCSIQKEIDYYTDAIVTIKAFDKIKKIA